MTSSTIRTTHSQMWLDCLSNSFILLSTAIILASTLSMLSSSYSSCLFWCFSSVPRFYASYLVALTILITPSSYSSYFLICAFCTWMIPRLSWSRVSSNSPSSPRLNLYCSMSVYCWLDSYSIDWYSVMISLSTYDLKLLILAILLVISLGLTALCLLGSFSYSYTNLSKCCIEVCKVLYDDFMRYFCDEMSDLLLFIRISAICCLRRLLCYSADL